MAEPYTEQEIAAVVRKELFLDPERAHETVMGWVSRLSNAERVCVNAGMFFEFPSEERKQRLKDSLDGWRSTRAN